MHSKGFTTPDPRVGMSRMMSLGSGKWALPLDPELVLRDGGGNALPLNDGTTQFEFGYRDIRFVGRLEVGGGTVSLRVVGDLGPMPFSAESIPARSGLTRICAVANEELGGTHLRVVQGRILLGAETPLDPPPTATGLLTTLARFLLPARPYLDLIAIYLRPPLAPAPPGEPVLQPTWRRRRH